MKQKIKKEIEQTFCRQERVKAVNIFLSNNDCPEGLELFLCYEYFNKLLSENKFFQNYKFWLIGFSDSFHNDLFCFESKKIHKKITPMSLYGNIKRKIFKVKGEYSKIFKIMELEQCNFFEALEITRFHNNSFIVATKRYDIDSDKNLREIYSALFTRDRQTDVFYNVNFVSTAIVLGKYSEFLIIGRGHDDFIQIIMDEHLVSNFF